ncbi:MAG TPA: ferrous iron transporter A [Pseudobacteroides sp.]|uniref:ferrous iron transporter A n=1 Tax=Pseudobacteroides sp. TaxID=1968840 RepID=UPI002F95270D
MKFARKLLAIFLVILITMGYLPENQKTAFAAPTFYLTAYAFESGQLTLRWPALAGTQSVRVVFHRPTEPVTVTEIRKDQITNTIDIPGLLDNIVYDIKIELYNNIGCTGSIVGSGLLYFCPNISFRAKVLEQTRKPVLGGGYEIGVSPALNLQWSIPKVWIEASDTFEYINKPDSLAQVQAKINSFYSETREFSTFNFRINISTDYNSLNSGSAQSAILVNQVIPNVPTDPISYTANVSGSSATASVNDLNPEGSVNFDLIGRASSSSGLPGPANTYQLPDADILPGTVYYMNIKPIVKNSSGAAVNAITVGPAISQNGSRLLGATPYVYSPLRFQISRDEANNVYVKVYRINQGSLDLPALKYEVQTGDDPTVEGDWKVRKSLNDSYFPNGSAYALTAFTVSNANNLIYYKVVVKTDASNDRLESPKMPYTITEDNSRPPVPTNLTIVDRTAVAGDIIDPQTNAVINIKSTDITVSWNKPSNWNEVKNSIPYDESKDLYFHFLLSTSQTDISVLPYPKLEFDGRVYGEFQVKYRLMRYVSARSPNIIEDGNRLIYKFKGFELFKGEDADGVPDNDIPNPDSYPAHLIPNKVYYLQMYTSNGAYKGSTDKEWISDRSVPISFTTLTMGGREVPMPFNLRLTKNNSETIPGPPVEISNNIELQFEKVSINWADYTSNLSVTKAVYYDLYASNSTGKDSFIMIGSTENPIGDVKFIGTDAQSTSIKVTLYKFSEDTLAYSVFGSKLKPNTTYYYTLKARLVFGSSKQESMFTAILPVTTVNGNLSPPDESLRNPIAPVDFSIAKDNVGNLMVSGSTVVFQWTNAEPGVRYEIICTTSMLPSEAPLSLYSDDIYYNSFRAALGDLSLDPHELPLADNFEYDELSKKCQYSIDQWISPNKLYYFSIRAENTTSGKTSAWVCIPVTTLLVESPSNLIPVTDSQIGISWEDTSPSTTPDDFKIFIKGPDDKDYKALTRSSFVVSREGYRYYGRVFNLKFNSVYNVRVYKGSTDLSLVLEKNGIRTMDKDHQVEVKWKGRSGYSYELAIKSSDDVDYTVLADSDLEQFTNADSNILPYYLEKSPEFAGTNFYNFYARIKTVATLQHDGTVKHVPLKSNMKYYVKVRAYKVDSLDTSAVSYSKYAGPTDIRTEFNQKDYDKTDQDIKKQAIFLDKIGKIEESLLWKMAVNSNINKLLLKDERTQNAFQNNGRYPFMLDITPTGANIDTDIIYIPAGIIKLMNTEDRSLVIKTLGTEFTIRPRTLDLSRTGKSNNYDFESEFFKMTITRSTSGIVLPKGADLSSKITTVGFKAIDANKNAQEVEQLIKDKLYNKDTGLVQERINLVLSSDSVKMTPGEMEKYLTGETEDMLKALALYIEKAVEGSSSTPGIIKNETQITVLNEAMPIKLSYKSSKGKAYPYILGADEAAWKKLTDKAYTAAGDSVSFTSGSTGKYTVITVSNTSADIPENGLLAEDIKKITAKYDLSSVMGPNGSMYPESTLSVKDAVSLYELLMGKGGGAAGLDTKQKIAALGLTDVFGNLGTMKSIEKQELAALAGKLYASKMGIDIGSFEPLKKPLINDEGAISAKLKKYVLLCMDIKVLSVDEKSNFNPGSIVTRAQVLSSLARVLEMTGDL